MKTKYKHPLSLSWKNHEKDLDQAEIWSDQLLQVLFHSDTVLMAEIGHQHLHTIQMRYNQRSVHNISATFRT